MIYWYNKFLRGNIKNHTEFTEGIIFKWRHPIGGGKLWFSMYNWGGKGEEGQYLADVIHDGHFNIRFTFKEYGKTPGGNLENKMMKQTSIISF